MITPKDLELFDLTEKEAKIYLASLKLGMDTVQNIAKEANIHRVSTYDILALLISKGLVTQTIKGKKRYFIASDPDRILDSLEQRKEHFSGLLPELKAIQNKGNKRPRVMYYEGKEAVWKAHQDRLKHKADLKENLVYGSSEKLLTTYPEGYKKFIAEKIKKGIRAKIIVEKSSYGLQEKRTAKKHLREIKFWPNDQTFKANTIIYGDRVLTISWDSMLAVIVEDKNNADNQRILFNLLWQFLS